MVATGILLASLAGGAAHARARVRPVEVATRSEAMPLSTALIYQAYAQAFQLHRGREVESSAGAADPYRFLGYYYGALARAATQSGRPER